MISRTTRHFWRSYRFLPGGVRKTAKDKYDLFVTNPFHESLQFKHTIADIWSVRINLSHRALGRRQGEMIVWFWIGPHDEYDKLLRRL